MRNKDSANFSEIANSTLLLLLKSSPSRYFSYLCNQINNHLTMGKKKANYTIYDKSQNAAICERIKHCRLSAAISRDQMAELLCMSVDSYRRLENNQRIISVQEIMSLAEIFKVDLLHLVYGANEIRRLILQPPAETEVTVTFKTRTFLPIIDELASGGNAKITLATTGIRATTAYGDSTSLTVETGD